MSSLVAYEDSDSSEEASVSVQRGSYDQHHEVRVCGASDSTPLVFTPVPGGNALERSSSSRPQESRFEWEGEQRADGIAQEKCFGDRTSLPANRGTVISPQRTLLPHTHHRLEDGSNQAKRTRDSPSGVRPYIPKRHKLSTSVEKADIKQQPTEQLLRGNQTGESPKTLSEVSERVKPYLSQRPGAAGIPKRLLMSLEGHRGPVNSVQWCPVPQLSHLLLSASMDKTFKVWDGVESGRCLRVYGCHSGAVRASCWTPCGRRLLTGSFDNTAAITDVETGQQAVKLDNQFKVMCAVLHPANPEVFLCGGYSPLVKAWDSRSCKVVKVYKAGVQQTLDILFLRGGADFITSSDCVSRDSADRTLIAWDYQTTAKVSNQIYHERYTCPSLALHPQEDSFVAQTNGDYMAIFSTQPPYRMNKRRQYKGHKVEGYAVRCEFSQDGTVLASGSSTGSAHFYSYHNARTLHTLWAHAQPCLCVTQHPLLPATAATCDWAGEIKVWH